MADQLIEIVNIETIILCGGLGTRLSSLTQNNQKCMLEINNKPFLQILIEQLKNFDLRRFVFATGKCSEEIEKHFNNIGIISKEDSPLGTGGAIKNALKHIRNKHFLVVNGDSYCDLPKKDFNNFIRSYNGKPTILASHTKNSILSSHFATDYKKYHGAGFYIFPKYIFKNVPDVCSLEHDCLPLFLNKEYYLLNECFVIDIGTPENLEKAQKLLRQK